MVGEYRVKCGQNFQSKNFGQNILCQIKKVVNTIPQNDILKNLQID